MNEFDDMMPDASTTTNLSLVRVYGGLVGTLHVTYSANILCDEYHSMAFYTATVLSVRTTLKYIGE